MKLICNMPKLCILITKTNIVDLETKKHLAQYQNKQMYYKKWVHYMK